MRARKDTFDLRKLLLRKQEMQNARLPILDIVFKKKDAILMKNLLVNDKST